MADLPEDRLQPVPPFSYVGVTSSDRGSPDSDKQEEEL